MITTRTAFTTVLSVSLLATAMACGSDDGGTRAKSTPTPVPSRSASKGPDREAAKAEVLAVYTKSWTEQVKAYAKASSAGTQLRQTTSLQALADMEQGLAKMRKAGQVTTGEPAIAPEVTSVTFSKIPYAEVTDCVDISQWLLVQRTTGKEVPLPAERRLKYVSTARVEKWGTKWIVTELTPHDRGC